MIFDVAIIGAGPAGTAAFVYASRKGLKTVLITESFGGQSIVSSDIKNWIGESHISGSDLAEKFKTHAKANVTETAIIKEYFKVTTITDDGENFSIILSSSEVIIAKKILYTAGSSRKKLSIKGVEEFDAKGVVYCASCDGPLYAGKNAVVIGGGNAGFESAFELLAYCPNVTLINRSSEPRADAVTVQNILKHPNFTLLINTEPVEIIGDTAVTGITIKNTITQETQTLPVSGIFCEIGQIPTTEIIKELVELSEFGSIKIDPLTGKTSHSRIWAAGDCTNILYHQNNIAAGDGIKALEDLFKSMHK